MNTQSRTRPVSATAYYLGRPAAFWLDVLSSRRRPTDHRTPHAPATVRCSSSGNT
jgi:hypothetical protein